jgi:two-component system nitrate/nitrite response regulator NarL
VGQERGSDAARRVGRAREPIRVYVVSPVRIYREGLTHVLATYPEFVVAGSAEHFETALPAVRRCEVDVALYDLRCPSGLIGLRRLGDAPEVSVVALGVEESVEWVIACAEAGIAGYVTDNTSLDELVSRVVDAARGDFNCPPHIAASLLRRLATIGPLLGSPQARSRLTSRELEVAALLQEGLSNRQIATRLTIQLPTVKNHVHSILRKLETSTRSDAAAVLRSSSVRPPQSRIPQFHD